MKNTRIKLILIFTVLLLAPAIASASQTHPPEIPVLFYGGAELNNNPAPVNAIISVIAEDSNLKIASGVIENIGKYFVEIPCQNYVGESIVFNLDNLTSGQNVCPDVMTAPSVKFDLSADDKQEKKEEMQEEHKNIGSSIIFPPTPCVKIIYDKWQKTCADNWQYRDIILKIPNNCVMTTEQKSQAKRKCGTAGLDEKIKVLGAEFYPDNSLIRGNGAKVYLIDNQTKRHIINIEALSRFFGREIFNVSEDIIKLYPLGEKIFGRNYKNGELIRGSDMKIYIIKNNKKYHIISLKELQKYAGQKIYNVSDETLARF